MIYTQERSRLLVGGYNIVELMIVLMLIALLSSLALPVYQGYLLRAYRNEARLMLLHAGTMQEYYFSKHNRYAHHIEELHSVSESPGSEFQLWSSERYALEIKSNTNCSEHTMQRCYLLSVHALGHQQKDHSCQRWQADQSGVIKVFDDQGSLKTDCL
jgi:type IV pilus assembly protein PilE